MLCRLACKYVLELGKKSVVARMKKVTNAKLITCESTKILLNLGDVEYIDSSGPGELVGAFTRLRNAGGQLKLVNLPKRVRQLLQITKLYTVFEITDDENVSISSFWPAISPLPLSA